MWRASWSRLARDVRGLSTVEYTVLLVLIVTGAISAWSKFGGKVIGRVQESTSKIADMEPETNESSQGN
jgi:Flp pilus assembly pilin Flp